MLQGAPAALQTHNTEPDLCMVVGAVLTMSQLMLNRQLLASITLFLCMQPVQQLAVA